LADYWQTSVETAQLTSASVESHRKVGGLKIRVSLVRFRLRALHSDGGLLALADRTTRGQRARLWREVSHAQRAEGTPTASTACYSRHADNWRI